MNPKLCFHREEEEAVPCDQQSSTPASLNHVGRPQTARRGRQSRGPCSKQQVNAAQERWCTSCLKLFSTQYHHFYLCYNHQDESSTIYFCFLSVESGMFNGTTQGRRESASTPATMRTASRRGRPRRTPLSRRKQDNGQER